jgi:AraC family transcriptional regulator of adaptative response/methylated-DNA-[protein]-cysteine methyltransferase
MLYNVRRKSAPLIYFEARQRAVNRPKPYVEYLFYRTPLGTSLLATENEVVIVHHIGDDEAALLADYTCTFPERIMRPIPVTMRSRYVKWLDGLVKGTTTARTPAVSLSGTELQRQVWRYLMTIPRGAQRSYSEVAQAIGSPRAVRAVASACARNQIALAIPCHRVVRADGSIGGYRWGIERKQWLLADEHKLSVESTNETSLISC